MDHLNLNIFRIVADGSHVTSKFVLIWAIHWNKSAEGVSLITQILYSIVFVTRYLDLLWRDPSASWYLFIFKNFYIWSSLYIILIMTKKYARTREREQAWKFAGYIMGGSIILLPLIMLIFRKPWQVAEVLWVYSQILESVCVLPQLLLLRQTSVPTVINSFYLVFLGSYRAFYILNWIWKSIHHTRVDSVSVIFGVIQTMFYIDFAWVYWGRQRVKLRGGTVVDSDDLRKGFLVNRFSQGRQSFEDGLEAGDGTADAASGRPANSRWGVRGVSIRADDTLDEHDRSGGRHVDDVDDERAPLKDPDQFEDDEDDDDAPAIDTSHITDGRE